MNKKTKKRMLMLSFVFLALWATATWASNDVLKVQSILGTAIQDIQKIYFSSWAVRDTAHPETEILMNLQNWSVHMWGRMLMAISWANDRMGKLSTWSSLFQGRNNTISWANSFLVWWSWNTIEQDAAWSIILWGTSNKIIKGIASYILWGNKNTISGDNSFIIGGVNNRIEWNNSYIFGFTGVKINANNSVAFWKNIEIEKDNVFMWNGATNKESASRENTFVMYAKNWLIIKNASGITVNKNNSTWALNVDWIMQISWEAVHCWPAIQGAIQYTWWAFGCFCGCNGTGWVSMTPTQKCRNLCPTINGFSRDGALCKYSEYDERDSLTKAEACEAWESSDIQEVTSTYAWDDGFSESYVSGWRWTCEDSLGGGSVSCETRKKLVKGKCGTTDLWTCQWESIFDETSKKTINNKNVWECLPVWYPVYWKAGWEELNTKEICSKCVDGYTFMEDGLGGFKRGEDWSYMCYKIEGTSCNNDVTIATDWNVWCTSWGVAKSTATDLNWNKTWNCESPTWSVWEKFCHTCNASANYVWSWWTTNKCVLKEDWVCATSWFKYGNQGTYCKTAYWVTWFVREWKTYKWYCKWANGWADSSLCHYCADGTWDIESSTCVSKVNWVCANTWSSTFDINNQSTWCTTAWWITWAVHNWNTYKWYCKWENWWNNSPLCNYCAGGTVWDGTSCVTPENRCEMPNWFTWNEISIANPDNPSLWFTIMDRDLWGETAGAWWWVYQWWNNYWFPSNYYSVSPSISELVDTTWYWPSNPYCSWTYVNLSYSMWDSHWISGRNNRYLWWGRYDDSPNYWIDPTNHNIVDLNLKKWPCPSWWHVPSIWEWSLLIKYLVKSWVNDWDSYSYMYSLNNTSWLYVLNNNTRWSVSKFKNYFNLGDDVWLSAKAGDYFEINQHNNIYVSSNKSYPIRTKMAHVRCFKDTYTPSSNPWTTNSNPWTTSCSNGHCYYTNHWGWWAWACSSPKCSYASYDAVMAGNASSANVCTTWNEVCCVDKLSWGSYIHTQARCTYFP